LNKGQKYAKTVTEGQTSRTERALFWVTPVVAFEQISTSPALPRSPRTSHYHPKCQDRSEQSDKDGRTQPESRGRLVPEQLCEIA
jgi:hypothetical protein